MSRTRMTGVVGFVAVAASAGALFLGASAAHAATPPFEPDPNAVGTLSFYDASGNQITSGRSDQAPFAAYTVGSTAIRSGDITAALFYAAPDPNKTTAGYFKDAVGNYTAYPTTTAPASINTLSQTHPVNVGDPGDLSLDAFRAELSSPSTAAGYDQIVQVRLRTANTAGQAGTAYEDASLLIDPVAHTWTEVYPLQGTITTLSASPNPVAQGVAVTLTAKESAPGASAPSPGSIQFLDGSSPIGSAVPVDGTGTATTSTSSLLKGTHSITAVFTPSDTTKFGGSTGSTSLVVTAPAPKVSLAVQTDNVAGDDIKFVTTVTDASNNPVNAGSIAVVDQNSNTTLGTVAGSAAVNGVYTLDLPAGLSAGTYKVVANFTPTDPNAYGTGQSAPPQTVVINTPAPPVCSDPGSVCSDKQNIQVTVPTGTLVINTPYTADSPLDLGTLALNTTGTQLTASKPFQNIKVTDLRNGVSGYTVTAQSSDLTDGKSNSGSTINSQNVGLTGVTATGDAGVTGTIATTSNSAADPAVGPTAPGTAGLGNAQHTVFKVTGASRGTVTANGTLTINAPTSTEPGLFKGTITFTVG